MRRGNVVKCAVVFAVVGSFVLSSGLAEAGGIFKKKPPEVKQKAVQPKKVAERAKPKPVDKAKEKKPVFTFANRELLIGFEETYMAEKNFQHSRFPEGDIQFESNEHLASLSYELLPGQIIKGKLGTARIKNKEWGYGWHDYELAWGFGGEWDVVKSIKGYFPKSSFALPYGLDMLVGAEYFAIGSDEETTSGGRSLKEEWEEWDIRVAFRKSYGAFTPYIGTRISWAEVKAKLKQNISGVEDFDGTLKSDDRVGGFLGVAIDCSKCGKMGTCPIIKDLSANFEVRGFDEFGITGGLNYTVKF